MVSQYLAIHILRGSPRDVWRRAVQAQADYLPFLCETQARPNIDEAASPDILRDRLRPLSAQLLHSIRGSRQPDRKGPRPGSLATVMSPP